MLIPTTADNPLFKAAESLIEAKVAYRLKFDAGLPAVEEFLAMEKVKDAFIEEFQAAFRKAK